MQDKTAIVILSDPRSGSEESLGRLFNALSAAYELKHADQPVTVLLLGTGTRWSSVLADANHPAHGLFEEVRDVVAGVSRGCAEVFGATAGASACGLPLLSDNAVPGTPGLASLHGLVREGYRILTF
jgi:hypothetical protein